MRFRDNTIERLENDLQDFLQEREAEFVRVIHNLVDEAVWEVDALVGLQLVLPILNVELAFLTIWIIEFAGGTPDQNWAVRGHKSFLTIFCQTD